MGRRARVRGDRSGAVKIRRRYVVELLAGDGDRARRVLVAERTRFAALRLGPSQPKQDQGKPRKTKENQGKPRKTKENQGKPRKKSLDSLGFIRIPSSDSGLFNGLPGNPKKKIVAPYASGPRPRIMPPKVEPRLARTLGASPSMPTSLSVPPPGRLIRNVNVAWISKSHQEQNENHLRRPFGAASSRRQTRSHGTRSGSRADR